MDENEALDNESIEAATPIFSVYRRGYDPEQVDRYVADQQRRLDEALHRASESERKLAAAVGQLRELHRRVAVYESEQRTAQPPALDSLGERVQRILQEAWEGAYNLRQEAEREVTELREQTGREIEAEREAANRDIEELRAVASREAAELVDEATRRALALRDEMDRRRQAYLERVERDRQRAVAQITFLYDQKQLAISELARLQTTVQATIEEMVRSPLGKPAAAIADAAMTKGPVPEPDEADAADAADEAGELEVAEADEAGAAVAEAEPVAAVVDAEPEQDAEIETGEYHVLEVVDDVDEPDDTADEPETESAALPASLFSQIIDDQDMASEELEAEATPAVFGGSRAEDTPTGPMEQIEYGYGYRSGSTATAAAPTPAADEEPVEEVIEPATRQRSYGGVYDAEADGWG